MQTTYLLTYCVWDDTARCTKQPDRELFVWAVVFNRMPLAMFFWRTCSDQIGSALVASMMLNSLTEEADLAEQWQVAEELRQSAM